MQSLPHFWQRLAERVAAHHAAALRPEFWWPSASAATAALVFLVAPGFAFLPLFPPAVLLAFRYHELAHFRAVHRSRWLWIATLLGVGIAVLWSCEHRAGSVDQVIHLGLAASVAGAAWRLRHHQLTLHGKQPRMPSLLAGHGDSLEPMWACAGPLGVLPAIFLWGLWSGLAGWRSPLTLAWGLLAAGLLVMQCRRHPLFPRACIAWLGLFLAIEARPTLTASEGDDWFLATMVAMLAVGGGVYLECHPRPRRTFRRVALPATKPPLAAPSMEHFRV
jgi:hypothetical protein